jgi:hypothetical protein
MAGARKQRRQERERGGEHQNDRGGGGERDAVEQPQPNAEEAEQGDHDGAAGEEHGAAGGADRDRDRLLDVAAVGAVGVAEAGDDKEGVIDADAEPDHERELLREVGRVDHVRQRGDQPAGGAEPEERGHDWQSHREEGAEADEQDDDRGGEADRGRSAERRPLRLLDRRTAELDLHPRRARRLGSRDHRFDVRGRERVAALVEAHGREADRSVARDLSRRAVGADDAGDVRKPADPRELGQDGRAYRRCGDRAGAGVEDDLVRVAGNRGEGATEQRARALRVGAGQRDAVVEAVAERAHEAEGGHQQDEPEPDHSAAMHHGPACNG